MLAEALVGEVDAFVSSFSDERLADGRQHNPADADWPIDLLHEVEGVCILI